MIKNSLYYVLICAYKDVRAATRFTETKLFMHTVIYTQVYTSLQNFMNVFEISGL